MNSYYDVFLEILNASIHNKVTEEDVLNQLTAQDLLEVLRLSDIHHVTPLVYNQIGKAEAFLQLPSKERENYKKRALRMVTEQTIRSVHFLQILSEMQKEGLDPVVVKGIIIRNMYPSPDLRPSADEDVLVGKDQFPDMDRFLKEHGYITSYEGPEIPHETGYRNLRTGVYLEIHTSLFEENSRYQTLFEDALKHTGYEDFEGIQIRTPEAEMHLLYLIAHAAKHFQYSGVGIRQICDLVVFTEHEYQKINFQNLNQKLASAGLPEFADSLFDLAEKYLGFSRKNCGMPERETTEHEELLKDIMEGGVYGSASAERQYSANITQSDTVTKGIWRSLFPSRRYMEQKYPELKDKTSRLPLFYLKRMKEYAANNRDILAPLKKGRERTRLIERYSAKEYSVDTAAYMENVKEALENGKEVTIPVVGSSMVPFLVNERDRVVIRPLDKVPAKGDIVLYRRDTGRYVMHRIVSVQPDTFTMAGDQESVYEKGIRMDQIMGYVVRAYRKGRWIDQNDRVWKFFSNIWPDIVLLHKGIVGLYSKLSK